MDGNKLLSENHRRSLSVTSKMIEEGLEEVEMKLNGNFNHRITQGIEVSYDKETKAQIFEIIKEIKSVNRRMFQELSLTSQKTYENRILQAQVVYLWSILIDSTSEKLSRYGQLSFEISKSVDAYITKLLALLEKLKEFD